MLRTLFRRIVLSFSVCMILFAVIVAFGRTLFPQLKHHRAEFVYFVSQILHQPVSIEQFDVIWRGLEPVLELKDVTVFSDNRQRALLQVDKIDVEIDILDSLWNRHITPGNLLLSGATLTVRETKNNEFTIDGISRFQSHKHLNRISHHPIFLLQWLFSQDSVTLDDIHIQFLGKNGAVVPIDDLHFSITNRFDEHTIKGSAQLSQLIPTVTDFVAHLHGDENNLKDWEGQFYLRAKDVVVGQWFNQVHLLPIELTSGKMALQLWGDLKHSQIEHLQALTAITQLNVKEKNGQLMQFIPYLGANFAYDKTKSGWDVQMDQIHMKLNGHYWPVNQVHLTHHDGQSHHDKMQIRYLRVHDVLPWLKHQKGLPLKIKKALSELKPHGILYNLSWEGSDRDWKVETRFHSLKWLKWKNSPAVSGLNGRVSLKPDTLNASLYSHHLTVSDPSRFSNPIEFYDVFTALSANKTQKDWQFTIPYLLMKHQNGSVNAALRWVHESNETNLSLLAGMQFNNIHMLLPLLPKTVLPKSFDAWLQDALKQGEGEAKVLFRGDPKQFPFSKTKGQFLVDSELHHWTFPYWPGWPTAHDIHARLFLDSNALNAWIDKGRLGEVPIKSVHANMKYPFTTTKSKILNLSGVFESPVSSINQYLKSSPLKRKFALLDSLQFDGNSKMSLSVNLPFENQAQNLKVKGDLHLQNAHLQVAQTSSKMTQLTGDIKFTEKEFIAQDLKASLFGLPVKINLNSVNDVDAPYLNFDMTGNLNLSILAKYFGWTLDPILHGQSPFQANLHVPQEGLHEKSTLLLSSKLHGIQSELPQPLHKKANETWPLSMTLELASNQPSHLVANVQNRLSMNILQSPDGSIKKGTIRVGSNIATLPKENALIFDGEINHVSVAQWVKAFSKMSTQGQGLNFLEFFKKIHFKVAELDVYGYFFHWLDAEMIRQTHDWWFDLSGPQIKGLVVVPKASKAIQAKLQRLYLDSDKTKNMKNHLSTDFSKFPSLDILIDDFQFQDKRLGRLNFETHVHPDKITFNHLDLLTPHYELFSHGFWGSEKTHLEGKLQLNELSKILSQFDIEPVMNAKKGVMQFEFDWAAPLTEFRPELLNGGLRIYLKRGEITHLDPKTEQKLVFGKLLSVLSLQTLPRRLTLDFRDLSSHNFDFNVLQGEFEFKNGVATTKHTFIDGPVAFVNIDGQIDLSKQDLDMVLKVSPHITASLPIVAGIAGGPVAGPIAFAATWVATKVLKKQIRKVSSYTYNLTGPWGTPVVKQMKIEQVTSKTVAVV